LGSRSALAAKAGNAVLSAMALSLCVSLRSTCNAWPSKQAALCGNEQSHVWCPKGGCLPALPFFSHIKLDWIWCLFGLLTMQRMFTCILCSSYTEGSFSTLFKDGLAFHCIVVLTCYEPSA
jgi:hypothetical protein